MTPLAVHVFYRRWFAGEKDAGQPGHAPYPTFYDEIVSHDGMHAYCAERQLEVLDEYGSNFYLQDIGGFRFAVGLRLPAMALVTRTAVPVPVFAAPACIAEIAHTTPATVTSARER